MKILRSDNRKRIDLVDISLMLIALTMPFDNNYNSYSIIAFGVASIFSNTLRDKQANLRANLVGWLLPITYFAWTLLNFWLDKSALRSGKIIEGNVSLLAFPLLLGSMDRISRLRLKRVAIAFAFSNIAGSFYCLYKAYYAYKGFHNYIGMFFYHALSEHIGINAIYYAMYCLFCIILLADFFVFNKTTLAAWLAAILTILYLSLFMLLLASKMFIFLLCLTVICGVGYACIRYRRIGLGFTALAVFVIGLFVLLNKLPYTKTRIEETKIKKYEGREDNFNGMAVREVLWKSALDLIKSNPSVKGMGHFTAQDSLREKYTEAGFLVGSKDNFNTHNQYLYTWLCYGYAGLALLLSFFLYFTLTAYKKRTFSGLALGILFIIANLTECMMETQKGIVFFLFFSSLFSFNFPGPFRKIGATATQE